MIAYTTDLLYNGCVSRRITIQGKIEDNVANFLALLPIACRHSRNDQWRLIVWTNLAFKKH
jgi:hypothetical protein